MNELNFFIMLGTGIVCLLIFTLIIYIMQKRGYELLEEKFNNNKINNETELEFRERKLSLLVEPLTNEIQKLNNNVNTIEKNRIESYGRLSEQVDILANGTRQLEQALRSPTSRGKWGEVQLQRILELSGMSEHVDFNLQKGLSEGGGRPDAIIHLPGNRSLAIDAKTPLSAYIEYTEAKSELEKDEKLKIDGIARFNSYELKNHAYAPNLPILEFQLRGRYNLFDKFLLNMDGRIETGRKALVYFPGDEVVEEDGQYYLNLGALVDFNLGIEYRYNKRITAFLQFNNMFSQRYYDWYNYPVQPIQVIGGVSFRF